MLTHLAPKGARRATLFLVALVLTLGVPLTVLAHAELDTSDPAAGSTVDGPFAGPIVMTFTEALAKESGADLVGSSGTLPSTTAVDGSTMTLTPGTPLAEGDYEIQWTSVADDGHIERGKIPFSVVTVATPAPTPSPTQSAQPSQSASAAPSATVEVSASVAATAAPSPSGDGSGSSSSGSDVILPIIAAVVILGGLGVFLLRRRDSGSAAS